MSAHEAAKRVTAFLDRFVEMNGGDRERLLTLDGVYQLRVSDLRAVVAALPLGRGLWRDIHEDTCAGRHCGGPSCCTCYRPPDYVKHWRNDR